MLEKINKDVKFTGKEYLDYLKYKDSKPKFKLEKNTKAGIFILAGILIFGLVVAMIVDVATYTPSTFKYTWEGIGMFLAICCGLGWVVHGTGFLLVRR